MLTWQHDNIGWEKKNVDEHVSATEMVHRCLVTILLYLQLCYLTVYTDLSTGLKTLLQALTDRLFHVTIYT